MAVIAAWPSGDRTSSTKASAAPARWVAATTAIGLKIAIDPDSGQTSSTGEPLPAAWRAEKSSVMPALNRPSATPVVTSSGALTWTAPLAFRRRKKSNP